MPASPTAARHAALMFLSAASTCLPLFLQLPFSCSRYCKTVCLILLGPPFKVTSMRRSFIEDHVHGKVFLGPPTSLHRLQTVPSLWCLWLWALLHTFHFYLSHLSPYTSFFALRRAGSCYALVLLLNSQCLGQNLMNWPTRDIYWTKTNMGIYFLTGVGNGVFIVLSVPVDSQTLKIILHHTLNLACERIKFILPEWETVCIAGLYHGNRDMGIIFSHMTPVNLGQ